MFFADVFDTKIVNEEAERYWAPIVRPETGDEFALPVPSSTLTVFLTALVPGFLIVVIYTFI